MMSLEDKRKKYGIPRLVAGSAWKNVQIFRLKAEERSAGGIILHTEANEPTWARGILLDAGLAAMDSLAEELIEIGDEVLFAHYAGRDREIGRDVAQKTQTVLECKVEDIIASVEQLERRKSHERYRDPETNEHMWRKR